MRYGVIYSIYSFGYIPQIWCVSRASFVPKPGKMDYTIAKSYRTISLTSFLLKRLEKLVDRYLRTGSLVTALIHPLQHALIVKLQCVNFMLLQCDIQSVKFASEVTMLFLLETFCLPLLSYASEVLSYTKQQLT